MSVMLFLLSTTVIEQSVTSVNCDICEQFHHTNCKKTDKVTKGNNTYDNVTTMAAFRDTNQSRIIMLQQCCFFSSSVYQRDSSRKPPRQLELPARKSGGLFNTSVDLE